MKNRPLLALGFRPFYTLAAAFAVVAKVIWLVSYTGTMRLGGNLEASRTDVLIFLMIQLAAISRVMAGVVADHRTMTIIAGVIWFIAFAVFLARYLPMLVSSRADGKPG